MTEKAAGPPRARSVGRSRTNPGQRRMLHASPPNAASTTATISATTSAGSQNAPIAAPATRATVLRVGLTGGRATGGRSTGDGGGGDGVGHGGVGREALELRLGPQDQAVPEHGGSDADHVVGDDEVASPQPG